MGDRPTKLELLDAVRRFIDHELLPELEGIRRFHARVASNVLAIVAREVECEPEVLPAQHARLCELLGRSGTAPSDAVRLGAELEEMERELCARIRSGEVDAPERRAAVITHLRATVQEKLAIANPGYQ